MQTISLFCVAFAVGDQAAPVETTVEAWMPVNVFRCSESITTATDNEVPDGNGGFCKIPQVRWLNCFTRLFATVPLLPKRENSSRDDKNGHSKQKKSLLSIFIEDLTNLTFEIKRAAFCPRCLPVRVLDAVWDSLKVTWVV